MFTQVLHYRTGIFLAEHVDRISRSKLYSKQNGKQFVLSQKQTQNAKKLLP